MDRYLVDLRDAGRTSIAAVGGKGAGLGELSRIDGINVPPGFAVTTAAFAEIVAPRIAALLERLSQLHEGDDESMRALSTKIRATIESIGIPGSMSAEVADALARFGENEPYAVRSSATAEDLLDASFAGQQDSFLGVVGAPAVLDRIRACWASLFTERAVAYRARGGFDHRKVSMAVVVQRMVQAEAAGVMFTADPLSGNRKLVSVEAVRGLGEALVAGTVNSDGYSVRAGEIASRRIASEAPVLTDEQVLQLAALGRRIEAAFGSPQDIEWCIASGEFAFVQSRPITTLFPVPHVHDGQNHVYLSVGHQQMMTDAMKPLGLSVWQLTTPRPMSEVGGRLFVDVTAAIASPATRAGMLDMMGKSDPLMRDALETVLQRGDFLASDSSDGPGAAPANVLAVAAAAPIAADPALVAELIERGESSIAKLEQDIRGLSGTRLLDFIHDDLLARKTTLVDPRSLQAIMSGMEAYRWLNEHMLQWLGEKNVGDVIAQSVPNNVTSEMGLALLDVADAIRPHAEVVEFLRGVKDSEFLDRLPAFEGGEDARTAILGWLETYGMRAVGEIDITRPRWSERPAMLLPLLLSHVDGVAPGESARRFEQGREQASLKERELLSRLRELPDGDAKAAETKAMIDRVRAFAGYREYPKYNLVRRYFVYKQALLAEAGRLVARGVLRERADIFFLRFEEIRDVLRTDHVDQELLDERKRAFASYAALVPPRVLTSDGEGISGSYRRDNVPAGALVGLPVSAGTVEGRARVLVDVAESKLEPGDILVTRYTDPSWTPMFVAASGLITEVGGMMTHGAVVAREYGLPAIVGVERATTRIRDRQRIRLHGNEGYVELLD